MNKSAKTLLILTTNLDGFSLVNQWWFTEFAKSSHYTLYFIISALFSPKWDHELCELKNVNISVGIPVVSYMVDTTVAQPTMHCCSVCGDLSNITQTIIGGLHFSKRSITFV